MPGRRELEISRVGSDDFQVLSAVQALLRRLKARLSDAATIARLVGPAQRIEAAELTAAEPELEGHISGEQRDVVRLADAGRNVSRKPRKSQPRSEHRSEGGKRDPCRFGSPVNKPYCFWNCEGVATGVPRRRVESRVRSRHIGGAEHEPYGQVRDHAAT